MIHDKTEVLTNYRKQNPNTLYKDQKIKEIDPTDLVQASTLKDIKMTSHTKWWKGIKITSHLNFWKSTKMMSHLINVINGARGYTYFFLI